MSSITALAKRSGKKYWYISYNQEVVIAKRGIVPDLSLPVNGSSSGAVKCLEESIPVW